MDLSVVPYDQSCRYGECMRNHAAARGGQAFDGCGEFMPRGADGSPESLTCAACGCHRSFHRRDGGSGASRRPMLRPIAYFPPPPLPLTYLPHHAAQPMSIGHVAPDRSRSGSETPPRADEFMSSSGGRKRNRTKFTAEQKEKMREFAERLGWRIQRHDDGALDRFCVEIGVDRQVLKVWMHNHKNQLAGAGHVAPPEMPAGPAGAGGASLEASAIRV